MRVAYWNINMGLTSAQPRITSFRNWVNWCQPDLLFLQEVGNTMGPQNFLDLIGMNTVVHTDPLDVNGNPCNKKIFALSNLPGLTGSALRFPGLENQRRLCLKVAANYQGSPFYFWDFHANASAIGGQAAVTATHNYLSAPGTVNALVGGDFNYNLYANLGLEFSIQPRSWQNTLLNFTQWNKVDGSTVGPNPYLYLTTSGVLIYRDVVRQGLLDFLMAKTLAHVAVYPNCPNEQAWITILSQFDHAPIVYDVT
jgi:endonuclease/exonuclease/phosphatase family metal-dependent hydrolase